MRPPPSRWLPGEPRCLSATPLLKSNRSGAQAGEPHRRPSSRRCRRNCRRERYLTELARIASDHEEGRPGGPRSSSGSKSFIWLFQTAGRSCPGPEDSASSVQFCSDTAKPITRRAASLSKSFFFLTLWRVCGELRMSQEMVREGLPATLLL